MNKKILLVGGGGHCKSVLDSLLGLMEYSEVGIVDTKENVGKEVLGVPVIGCDDDLPGLFADGFNYAFISVGSIGYPKLRLQLLNKITEIGFQIPNIIDSSAIVSRNATMKTGIFIGKNTVINAGSVVHKGVIVNTGAIIEHDCSIGEFAHIAPGSVLSGEVQIGANTHIGANSVIRQQLRIGFASVVGMGSVVTRNIGDNILAYGNPCKEVRSL